jgi:hypothetical protein
LRYYWSDRSRQPDGCAADDMPTVKNGFSLIVI